MAKKTILDYFNEMSTQGDAETSENTDTLQSDSAPNAPSSSGADADTPYASQSTSAFEVPGNIESKYTPKKTMARGTANDTVKRTAQEASSGTADAPCVYDTLSSDAPQPERYPFVLDIRDKEGRRPAEKDYDPSTLYIPDAWFKKFTPFEKQFWSIKKEHFDTIIMFKKGAFYELYEFDAELSARLFDFKISSRVNMRMSGFPEKSYDQWAAKFLELGYKIGRVEQAENALGKKMRERNEDAQKEKIIARELKEILTVGTIYNADYLISPLPFYVAVVVEDFECKCMDFGANAGGGPDGSTGTDLKNNASTNKPCASPNHFSVLLYDASINKIYAKSFGDSYDLSCIKTIFIQNDIREVITDLALGFVGKSTHIIKPFRNVVATARKYDFANDSLFQCYTHLYGYMKSLCREATLEIADVDTISNGENMVLDGATIANLDILSNNYDGTAANTLFEAIDHCTTPFGKRLLKRWLMSPLTSPEKIRERRQASSYFEGRDLHALLENLRPIGDTERYLGKLCNANPAFKDLVLFMQSIKRCRNFIEFMQSFLREQENALEMVNEETSHPPPKMNEAGRYVEFIDAFIDVFHQSYKITESEVVPGDANSELLDLTTKHSKIEGELRDFLEGLKKRLGMDDLCYKNVNSEIFQIEAPAGAKLPPEFYVVSSTKTLRRYYSAGLKRRIEALQEAEEQIFQSKGMIFRKAIAFIEPYRLRIHECIDFVAIVDCYISYALYDAIHGCAAPQFIEECAEGTGKRLGNGSAADAKSLCIEGMRNPIYTKYIKNAFEPRNRITIVTGPNMGGKSTFLRSICLNIILAQMGMKVPCARMALPVFDRIFTRIGASDSLARGESTFMAEMNEASRILNQSTARSFVIMDELGRGTSTRDGDAIARAVLDCLKKIGCYTLFSTHYHRLVSEYCGTDRAYMDCVVDGNDIVFLYKVRDGVCLDSHGLYVARMAGIPADIVDRAMAIKEHIVKEME